MDNVKVSRFGSEEYEEWWNQGWLRMTGDALSKEVTGEQRSN